MSDTDSSSQPSGAALLGGFLALIAVFVSLLWFACTYSARKEEDEQKQKAGLEAKLAKLREERQLQEFARNANKAPAGYLRITKELPLRVGMPVYEQKPGMKPEYVGSIESIREQEVVVTRKSTDATAWQPPKVIDFSALYERHLTQ